jgi:hypothetical protein
MSKTYFLAPTRDVPPSGPISLGSIITSPRSPELSLNGRKSSILQSMQVDEHSISDSSRQLVKTKNGNVGIWTEFLGGVLGIGGDVGGNWEHVDMVSYQFKELITKTISPDLDTVRTLFEEPAIQKTIRDSYFRSNLYMITGIKIARGADVVISKVRARGGNLYFGVDTTAAGVPIKVGPDIAVGSSLGQDLTEHHTTDFVFAYRLRELVYRRKALGKQREYAKGDLMHVGEGNTKPPEEEDLSTGEIELRGIQPEDLKAEDWELDATLTTDDDGEECNCVTVEADDDDDR